MPPIPTPSLQSSLHSSNSTSTTSTSRSVRRKQRHSSDFSKSNTKSSSVTNLIDRLLIFLETHSNSVNNENGDDKQGVVLQGLALPAQAVSWLGFALCEIERLEDASSEQQQVYDDVSSVYSKISHSSVESFQIMGLTNASVVQKYTQRLVELRERLLPLATHVRITDEVWPNNMSTTSSKKKQMYVEENDYHHNTSKVDSVISTVTCGSIGSSMHSFRGDSEDYFDFSQREQEAHEDGHLFNDNISVASSSAPLASMYTCSWQAPRVDLSIFPNLTVLVLDSVPPEWLCNIDAIRPNLKLIRLQGGAIFDLGQFLFPDSTSIVQGPNCTNKSTTYPNLTHLRLSRCAVGELSGLTKHIRMKGNDNNSKQNRKKRKKIYSPLSRLPNLTALNLSHNEIVSASTVFAGVKNLPLLTRIDLSYNRIKSLKKANYVLGNIRILVLSHNKISCLQGIDRLYGLERLALDHNALHDLSNAAPLAKLPCLNSILLKGNPFTKRETSYRIQVLHLFQQARCNNMFADDIFLPQLDEERVTENELEVLGQLFFSKDIRKNDGFKTTRLGYASPIKFSTSRPKQVIRSMSSRSICITNIESRVDFENSKEKAYCTIQPAFESTFSVCDVISSNNSKAKSQLNSRAHRMKRIRSLRTKKNFFKEHRLIDTSEDSADDEIISSPYSVLDITSQFDDNGVEQQYSENDSSVKKNSNLKREPVENNGYCLVEDVSNAIVNGPEFPPVAENNYLHIHDESIGGMMHTRKFRADHKIRNSPPQPIKPSHVTKNSKATLAVLDHIDASDITTYESLYSSNGNNQKVRPSGLSSLLEKIDELDNSDIEVDLNDKSVPLDEAESNYESNENNSILEGSQICNSAVHDTGIDTVFIEDEPCPLHDDHIYEDDQQYDGPIQHSNLEVNLSIENIKLYFRSQVFGISTEVTYESHPWRPRILLQKYDKDIGIRERNKKEEQGKSEIFVDLFLEDVISCGRASSVRVPPKVTTPKGFDGENDSNRLGLVSEAKKSILCFSDEAFYLIPTEYMDEIQRNEAMECAPMNRPFPSPIGDGTLFKDGTWPHAVARHCYEHLVSITIGFQFQRLVLHFVVPGREAYETDTEFSYVCQTRCKQKTMALFRILQVRAQKAKAVDSLRLDSGDFFAIENDDQMFLDSISDMVTACHPGSILYYHIVDQYWSSKHNKPLVRRSCVISDSFLFLFDEMYRGDGSSSSEVSRNQQLKYLNTKNGTIRLQLVEKAALKSVLDIIPDNEDPRAIKIIVKSEGALWNTTTIWRLMCSDGNRAEDFVTTLRQIMRSH